jgi:two-component system phosphate regulon sensor histidine kinase PhoR
VKRETLRYVLILAIFSLAGIISIQIYWFSKAFDEREKQFNQTVSIALRNVSDRMLEYNNLPIPQVNPVEQLSSNYYVVMFNNVMDAELLETLLINEFTKRDLDLDFEYGIYDCMNEEMVYGNYVDIDEKNSRRSDRKSELPVWEDNDYYFGVLFPTKDNTLLGQMGIWIFSSMVLLVVILFFAYALYIIFKQRKLSETQKQFINNMTHEFRTPISTILLSSDVLKDPDIVSNPGRLGNYARIIKEESNRLLHQVENILQSTIIEEKKAILEVESCDAHQLIKEVVENFNLLGNQQLVKLHLNAKKPSISADKIHFSNAIKNLVDNAIKYSTGVPEVTVNTKNHHDELIIEISDKGIGINKEYHKKIFQKFYRVPTGNLHDIKGFGIGLHYVKNIVEMHQGHIHLSSKPGEGSTFTIKIPLADEQRN